MNDDLDWTHLDRYFSGQLSRREANALDRWAARDASRTALLAQLRRVWAAGGVMVDDDYDVVAAWAHVSERMQHEGGDVLPLRMAPRGGARRAPRARLWEQVPRAFAGGIAAMLLVGIGGGIVAWRTSRSPIKGAPAMTVPTHEYATARGQRAELTLADGTRIWMSVASRLRVPADYNVARRDVYLDGEAYFEVVHDPARPFVVHAPQTVAEDLGTRFVVRAYRDDATAIVTVAEGRVAVRSDRQTHARGVALERGQAAHVDTAGLITILSLPDAEAADIGWRDGGLQFRRVPFADVARELERWYDVQITLSDTSMASVPLTARFDNKSLDGVLRALGSTLDVRYERRGREVRFLPPRRAR